MDTKHRNTKRLTESEIQQYRLEGSEQSRHHFPYEKEEQFVDALTRGDSKAVFQFARDVWGISPESGFLNKEEYIERNRTRAGVMSHSETKQIEYGVVSVITVATRAAIRGGVDPFRAYDISDLYLQKLSETQDFHEYQNILIDSVDSFLKEIRLAQSRELRSVHALRAKQYIGQNLNKTLTLPVIAEAVGLSPSYLSAMFIETEGIGLKQYILRQRMEAAKNLLLYSDADIGTIATYVGFCDQSHFGKMFKQSTGMTPRQYRVTQQK